MPGLGVGTFVVPINPRHPCRGVSLAQNGPAASHGRLQPRPRTRRARPEQQAFGTAWPNTVERLREHLQVFRSIIDTGAVDFHGPASSPPPPCWPVALPAARRCRCTLGHGAQALTRDGRARRRHVSYLAAARRTIEETITRPSPRPPRRAGRPAPRVIAAVPVLVTDDVDAGRAAAAEVLAFYTTVRRTRRSSRGRVWNPSRNWRRRRRPTRCASRCSATAMPRATDLVLSPLRGVEADRQRLSEVAASPRRWELTAQHLQTPDGLVHRVVAPCSRRSAPGDLPFVGVRSPGIAEERRHRDGRHPGPLRQSPRRTPCCRGSQAAEGRRTGSRFRRCRPRRSWNLTSAPRQLVALGLRRIPQRGHPLVLGVERLGHRGLNGAPPHS